MYLCMFSLCCSQKRQDNFALSELRYRVSDKLGPAVRKQKTNAFKLLEVMHKYLSAIHAGLDCEQSLYFLQLATRVSACVFSRVLFDGLRKKRDCS